MPRSPTPAGPLRLAMRTFEDLGESLLPAAFVCGYPLPVPQSVPERCLAASRCIGVAPDPYNVEDSSDLIAFGAASRGLSARCLRLAAPPHDGSTQDSLAASGQLLLRGIDYPQGSE